MGIPGLWKEIKPAIEVKDLTALALQQRPHGGLYRVGVDVSLWLRQCSIPFQHAHAQAGKNPELRTIFFRLAYLFTQPISLVFVADGPERPACKRGKKVIKAAHWMTSETKRLVEAFGFEWLQAPGEAEAQLALLNTLNIIDAVMTDDGDALVFGARVVIRNRLKKADHNNVHVVTSDRVNDHPRVGLSPGGMLLIAVLAGGDYHEGLRGCGAQTAHALAQYGLGDKLMSCVLATTNRSIPPPGLPEWRAALRNHLRTDPQGRIGRRCPALASAVSDEFPDPAILRAYVRPVADTPDHIALDPYFARTMRFDMDRLEHICKDLFSWDEAGQKVKMQKLVWPGVVLRLLAAEHHPGHPQEHQISITDVALVLDSIRFLKSRTNPAGFSEYQVIADISPASTTAPSALKMWIPVLLLTQSRQDKIFTSRSPSRTSARTRNRNHDTAHLVASPTRSRANSHIAAPSTSRTSFGPLPVIYSTSRTSASTLRASGNVASRHDIIDLTSQDSIDSSLWNSSYIDLT